LKASLAWSESNSTSATRRPSSCPPNSSSSIVASTVRELVARLLDSVALGQQPERLEHLGTDRDFLLGSVQATAAFDCQDRLVALPAYAELGALASERQVALEDAGTGSRVVGDCRDEELALDLVTRRHARAVPQPAIGLGCLAARFRQRRSTERAKLFGRRP
jgi:hypothetical protein